MTWPLSRRDVRCSGRPEKKGLLLETLLSGRCRALDVSHTAHGRFFCTIQIMKELVDGLGLTGVEKVTLIKDRKTGECGSDVLITELETDKYD